MFLLEPDELHRQILTRRLGAAGHQVQAFGEANEALAALELDPPEVLVLSSRPPDRPGPAVVQWLRASPLLGELRILGLAENMEDRRPMLNAGCDECVFKPLDIDRLLLTIEQLEEFDEDSTFAGFGQNMPAGWLDPPEEQG